MRRVAGLLVATVLFGAAMTVTAGAAVPGKTVRISGKTFRFGKRYPVLVNALVKVREFPGIWALSDEKGDYELTVPDNANVTPYIVSGWNGAYSDPRTDPLDPGTKHYNSIDLQTFHTRGQDIENANFQTPTDLEYNALKLLLGIKSDADNRPEQCAIVTTSSARNVRGVSYDTYWDNTPHGVPGATAYTVPGRLLPSYFNDAVIPDPNQTSSSADGGIIWSIVPTGTYRVITEHPATRFASFLATCRPGRVVNANPPWGAYELAPGERPLSASNVAASLGPVNAKRVTRRKRVVRLKLDTGERIGVELTVRRKGRVVASRKIDRLERPRMMKLRIGPRVKAGRIRVSAKMTDASGVSFTDHRATRLPKTLKPKQRAKRRRGKRR